MLDFQRSFLVGKATGDWSRLRTRKDNSSYTSFRVSVNTESGRNTTLPILAFGALGEKIAAGIDKDTPVLVIGRLVIDRRGQAAMVADHLQMGDTFKQKA